MGVKNERSLKRIDEEPSIEIKVGGNNEILAKRSSQRSKALS